jgi:hypothetical protein
MINNLPATESGTKYTISINSDLQQDGNIYKAEPITVTVTKFNTSKVALKFMMSVLVICQMVKLGM